LAYGIGGLTPDEFWDLTPAELNLYIKSRIEWQKEQTKMENDRIGLLAAILQNGIPIIHVKKLSDKHKPDQYFKSLNPEDRPKRIDPEVRKSKTQKIYDTMMAWANATKGGK
jgi:hypothetical protein